MKIRSEQFRAVIGRAAWSALVLLVAIGFTTFAAGAATSLISRSPETGEELAIDGAIALTFDRPMDRASIEAGWSISAADGTPLVVPGMFEWPEDRTVRFVPEASWARDAVYVVTISTDARGIDGEPLGDAISFSFRTVGYLEVTQVIPADGTYDVAADSTVLVIFNRPVVPLTAVSDPGFEALPDPLRFEPEVAGSGEWLNTSIYVFTPDAPLRGGTTYTAIVPAGLTDTTGGIVANDVTWRFTTERPDIVWTSPYDGEELVPIDAEIRIEFNMPIDLESARERFVLRTTGLLGSLLSRRVDGLLEADGSALVFTPSEPLAFDQAYAATLDAGVIAREGGWGMEESIDWSFRTVPLPRITGTSPKDGDRAAYPYTSFLIHFNAPIDPDTVMDHVSIEPQPDPEDLYGYFRTWDLTYVLQFGARPSSRYTVRIRPGIADPYGNEIGQSVAVTFETDALDPTAWLHVPGRVGTTSTHQPARIFIGHRNVDSVTLTLTRIDLDEYSAAIDDWYRYDPPAEDQVRRWTVPVSSELNEIGYTPTDLLADGGALEPGIYVVDLRGGDFSWNSWQHRHLLVASPANLTIKTSADETLVWATDLATGDPIPGLILRAFDGTGEAIDAAITDRDGLATFPGSDDYDWRGLTIAGLFPFTLASTQWDDGISTWEFGLSYEGESTSRAHVETDRPIYRPGQTVHFRAVLRDESDAAYSVPMASSADVTVWDAAWNLLHEETVELDRFGTLSGDLSLEDGAALGTYWIEISAEGHFSSHTFQVAAYRPPEFEVDVTPAARETAAGQSIDVAIELAYFFGGPVAGQDVDWRVFSQSYRFSPSGFGQYTFADNDDPWYGWGWWWASPDSPSPILDGSGTTDASGRLVIELPEDIATRTADLDETVSGSRTVTIEATALGNDGQTLSSRDSIVVHAGDFYIGLASARSIGRAGDPMTIDLVTVDWLGERVANRALRYEVVRREWENVFEEDEAGGGRWTWTKTDIEIDRGDVATDENGAGLLTFTPPEGGTYKVLAIGEDAAGRVVRSSRFVWVTGPETVSWRRSNDDRISLISDKTEYLVGETAEILIPSPFEGPQWALVTVERAGILTREVVRLESNSATYSLPITDAHIPNVYVSVVLVQGENAADAERAAADMKVGYVSLAVSREPRVLRIELTPSTEVAGPGDPVAYDVSIRDADGLPVEASLSFDLVDKAVLSLMPRTADAIVETFYGLRGLGVGTASGMTISLDRLVIEQMDEIEQIEATKYGLGDTSTGAAQPLAAPMAADEDMMMEREAGGSDDGTSGGIEVREDFQDTAFWSGSVITDADGHARIEIDLPDNLTTFVARAVGATVDTLVGEGVDEILVTKPLLVRPVTPRFLVVGDRVRLAVNVSNQTEDALAVDVSLLETGLELETAAVRQITIPAHGETTVAWWAVVEDVASVDVVFQAVSGELSDAARPRLATGPDGTLLVYRYTAPETVGTAGQLTEAGSLTEIVALPPNAEAERSALLVRLETSLAAAMQQGLDYLEHFEYECTEQVVSRFLPNVLTYRALQRLGIEDPELAERLPALVAEGLEKLYLRQNSDGGWGWWDVDESSPYLTSYVAFALIHARDAGFLVDERVLDDALDYLEDELVSPASLTSTVSANRQAWIVLVLTMGGRTRQAMDAADALYEARSKLSHYARAFLALALDRLDAPAAWVDTLVSDLYNAAILSATGAHWEEENYDWWAMNTDTRSTAVILDALVQIDPTQPMLPNVVRWLMVARKDGIWETTQETAWALIALTDWMEATGELAGSYDYSASLDGSLLTEGTADPTGDPVALTIPAAELSSTEGSRLSIRRGEGEGTLYYTAHLSVRLPVDDIEPLNRGIIVQRQYVAADCPLDEVCESVSEVKVGDTIQVRLTIIAPHDLYYVVVEDPYPAGCEAVDTTLATTSLLDRDPGLFRQGSDGGWPWFYWWWWRWYTRSELRDEKAVLFADYLPAGTYSYQYSLRATVPGQFQVIPASASEFYFPEVFGRSDGMLFTVLEAE